MSKKGLDGLKTIWERSQLLRKATTTAGLYQYDAEAMAWFARHAKGTLGPRSGYGSLSRDEVCIFGPKQWLYGCSCAALPAELVCIGRSMLKSTGLVDLPCERPML
jgi:hypothetical protein